MWCKIRLKFSCLSFSKFLFLVDADKTGSLIRSMKIRIDDRKMRHCFLVIIVMTVNRSLAVESFCEVNPSSPGPGSGFSNGSPDELERERRGGPEKDVRELVSSFFACLP